MATEEEIIEILLQSSGQEDLEESARKTVKTWQDAFRLIEDAYPDPIDAFDDIVNDINQVKDAISQGFQVEGVDWTSLFSDMEDAFKDSAGRINVTDWWDSILKAMFASGIDSQYIDQFVQDFESQLRDALGDIDVDIDPPDIDFSSLIDQWKDAVNELSNISPDIDLDKIMQQFQDKARVDLKFGIDIDDEDVLGSLSGFLELIRNMADSTDMTSQEIEASMRDMLNTLQDTISSFKVDPPDIDFTDTEQQLRDMLSLFSGMETIGLGNLFDIQSVDEFTNAISGLNDINLNYVNRTLDELAARVGNMNIDDIVKDETIARLKEFQEAINQIRFDPTEDVITQIQQVMDSLGQNVQLDLGNIFDFNGIDDLREAISNLSENELRRLYDYLDQAADKIQHLNIDEAIKEGTVTQLREYLELIRQLNEEHKETSEIGGSRILEFLGKYKFSLMLIGGALGAITGMIRYSTVFGTSLDIIGQAIGYLADSILFPLLPAIMYLAEWIMGLADWFNQLPDPIKLVISSLFVLVAVFMILRALGIIGFFKSILTGLWELAFGAQAAGALTGSGLILGIIAGLLVGFAAVYLLIQTGALDAVARLSQTLQEANPIIVDAVGTLLGPLGLLGIIIVDALTGQFDKIPEHLDRGSKMIANYFVAFGARILAVVTGLLKGPIAWLMEAFAGIGVIGGHIIKTFGNVGDAIFDAFAGATQKALSFFELLAKGGEKLGLFKGLSESIEKVKADIDSAKEKGNTWQEAGDWAIEFWGNFGQNAEKNVDLAKSKWEDLAKEFEGYNRDAFNENLGEYSPGSIFNGFTYADQMKAFMEQQNKDIDALKNKLTDDAGYLGDPFDYTSFNATLETYKELDTAQQAAIKAQDELNDALYGETAGSKSADEITRLTNNVTNADKKVNELRDSLLKMNEVSLNPVNNSAEQMIPGSTRQLLKTGDLFRTDDRDTDKSLSVNEMMKSRYDKIMHDYHTQSKYKNDAYLNPVNKAVEKVSAPVDVPVSVTPDVTKEAIEDPVKKIIQDAVPTAPVKVPVEIEPDFVIEAQISKEAFITGVVAQLNPLFSEIWKRVRGDDWAQKVKVPVNQDVQKVVSPDPLKNRQIDPSNPGWLLHREKEINRHLNSTTFAMGEIRNQQIDPALIGTEIADAMERNNTANQLYTDLLSEIASSKSAPQMPNAPVPTGNQTTQSQPVEQHVDNSVTNHNTFQISSLDYKKIAEEISRYLDQGAKRIRV